MVNNYTTLCSAVMAWAVSVTDRQDIIDAFIMLT